MAQSFRMDLKQSQQLVMTPQLQQAIKLLQMSNLDLREFVEHEMESNPLIRVEEGPEGATGNATGSISGEPEVGTDAERGAPPENGPEHGKTPLDARLTPEGDHSLSAEIFDTGAENLYDSSPGSGRREAAEWARTGAGGGGYNSGGTPGFNLEQQPDRPVTLRKHLLAQLGQSRAAPPVLMLARILVEELDEQGFLRSDPAGLGARHGATADQATAALALLQDCEPTGVAARDLAECLALQLAERDRLDPAMRRLVENLDLLLRGERRRLRALCRIDEEDFSAMLAELRALDPRPGARFQFERAETLIPDVFLRRVPGGLLAGGGWEVELNTETLPRVLVDNRYAAQISATGAEARDFISDCRASANWLKRSLDQRARTILAVATEIVRHQDLFFAKGVAGLKPLTLQMVAEAVGLHESTVSRVTSNKYIATGHGIFELKFFFTNAVGPNGLAAEAVRHKIRIIIYAEEPGRILSDDTIVERLQKDGVEIARRTVAKYRKSLGIASSAVRRRAKAMMSGN